MKQLFCISYAGGNARFFQNFEKKLDQNIECVCIEYAGRGDRRNEKAYATFDEMVQDVATQINKKIDRNAEISLFGYSMGSLVAYEIIANRKLIKEPSHLFLAAHYAPTRSSVEEAYSTKNDQELIDKIASFGGLDERLISNKRFWPMFLPQIRNDYYLLENYDFLQVKRAIPTDITIFYSDEDTPFKYIEEWKSMTEKTISYHEIKGGHFFLKSHDDKIADVLNAIMINE